jgi:hypothetical protein
MLGLIYVAPILLGSCVQAAPNGDDIGSVENVDGIASQESAAFDRYDTEFLNCSHMYLGPAQEAGARPLEIGGGKDLFTQLDERTKDVDKQLNALAKCDVDAAARLKTQLWGNLVEVNSSPAQVPPNWAKISSHNNDALKQHDSEKKACHRRFADQTKTMDWAAPSFEAVFDEEMMRWGRCDIEAAARLKAQLWSP